MYIVQVILIKNFYLAKIQKPLYKYALFALPPRTPRNLYFSSQKLKGVALNPPAVNVSSLFCLYIILYN